MIRLGGGALIAAAALFAEVEMTFLELLILAALEPCITTWKDVHIARMCGKKEKEDNEPTEF